MIRRIWLPITEQKCTASKCRNTAPCARRDVAQDQGRPRVDFSVPVAYGPAECAGPKWAKHIDPALAVKPEPKRKVRDWIGQ